MRPHQTIFSYGTLAITEVLEALLGDVPSYEWATLHNWQRFRIDPATNRGAKGPAARPAPNEQMRGRVLRLDEREWTILDAFEQAASGYVHTEAVAKLDDDSEVSVIFYAADEQLQNDLIGVWDPEEFRDKWLEMYLTERIPAFMKKHGFRVGAS